MPLRAAERSSSIVFVRRTSKATWRPRMRRSLDLPLPQKFAGPRLGPLRKARCPPLATSAGATPEAAQRRSFCCCLPSERRFQGGLCGAMARRPVLAAALRPSEFRALSHAKPLAHGLSVVRQDARARSSRLLPSLMAPLLDAEPHGRLPLTPRRCSPALNRTHAGHKMINFNNRLINRVGLIINVH